MPIGFVRAYSSWPRVSWLPRHQARSWYCGSRSARCVSKQGQATLSDLDDHYIQIADAVNVAFEVVAFVHRAHTRWRAGEDQIAGFELPQA